MKTKREFLTIVGLICILAAAPMYYLTGTVVAITPIVILFLAVILMLRIANK